MKGNVESPNTSRMWPLQFFLDFDIRSLFLFFFVLLLIVDYLRYKNPPNFPPGPLSLPFVGSFFSVDTKHPHNYFTQVIRQAPPAGRKILLSTFLQISVDAEPPSGYYSSLPSFHLCLFICFPQLAEVYGKLFSIRLGNEKIVFVSGYKMVKEAIVTQADNFVDRPFNAFGDRIYRGQRGVQTSSNFSLLNLPKFLELLLNLFSFADGLFQNNGEIWKRQRRFALSTLRNFGLGKNILEENICEEVRHLVEEMRNHRGEAKTSLNP